MNTSTVKPWWPVVILAGAAAVAALAMGGFLDGLLPTGDARASHNIERVDAGSFEEKVLQSKVPVLVDFYADWCRPCRALAPVLEEFAGETPNVKVVKVNVDQSPELATRYRIKSIPHLLVFRDGRLTNQHGGIADKAFLTQLLVQREVHDDN